MAKVIFLGTAAAIASKNRDNTCLLIIEGKEKVLIDCPGSPLLKLERLNIDYQKISNILLTHSHIDHIYGLFSLLHSQYKLNNTVRIFGHKKTIATVRILRKIFHLKDTNKYPKVIFREVSPFMNGPF